MQAHWVQTGAKKMLRHFFQAFWQCISFSFPERHCARKKMWFQFKHKEKSNMKERKWSWNKICLAYTYELRQNQRNITKAMTNAEKKHEFRLSSQQSAQSTHQHQNVYIQPHESNEKKTIFFYFQKIQRNVYKIYRQKQTFRLWIKHFICIRNDKIKC